MVSPAIYVPVLAGVALAMRGPKRKRLTNGIMGLVLGAVVLNVAERFTPIARYLPGGA